MTNEEKLQKLIEFLDKNNIKYVNATKKGFNYIKLTVYDVNVKLSDEKNDEFFKMMRRRYPVFIRDEDSADFVIEKVQNTIVKSLRISHNKFMKSQKKLKANQAEMLQSETHK